MNKFVNKFRQICWVSLFPLMLIVCFFSSWVFWSSQNFLYQVWYDHTELKEFIDYFAPQNELKPEFSQTDRDERVRLFNAILKSINSNGSGLDKISFHSPKGEKLGTLLTENEIIHLIDVSRIVSIFKMVSWFSIILFFSCLTFLYFYKTSEILNIKKLVLFYILLFSFSFITILIIGPLEVFELLHEFVFPNGHQWFFYYQESLMTTLMMAPKLFMYFASLWIFSGLLLFFAMIIPIRRLLQ